MEFQWLSFIGELLWCFLWLAIGFVIASMLAAQQHCIDRGIIAALRFRIQEIETTKWSDAE